MTITPQIQPSVRLPRRKELTVGSAYLALLSASLPLYAYRWHLLLHIVGGLLLVATVTIMAAWMIAAVASDGAPAIRTATQAVATADIWLTALAVILVLGNGIAMTLASPPGIRALWTISWIALGFAALLITGLIWAGVLIPAQLRMLRAARADAALSEPFFHDFRRWRRTADRDRPFLHRPDPHDHPPRLVVTAAASTESHRT